MSALAATGSFSVLYLGDFYSRHETLRDHLPSGWAELIPGPLLNGAAGRLRDLVINLDSLVWPADRDPALWDATRLGERGPLTSPLMINLCRLLVFVEAIAMNERLLVIGDDVAQCRIWMAEAHKRGRSVTWLGPTAEPLKALRRAIRIGKRRAAFVARFAMRKLQLAWLRRRHRLPREALRKCQLLLTVWGRRDTFPDNAPIAREANFGALPDLLNKAGFRVGYLVYPIYTQTFKDVAVNALASVEPTILVEDLIPWSAIFKCALAGLGFATQVGELHVDDIDATSVLHIEADRERELAFCSEALLLRHAGRQLTKFGIHPDMLMHLYEAQPWEKMLARGVREGMHSSTRIVGVQHAPFSKEYISFFPSQQSLSQSVPDLLLVAGEGYQRWMHEAGFPLERIGVLGAVRYHDVGPRSLTARDAILCCTGIDLDESLELATKAALATVGLNRSLVVNFHPVTDEVFRSMVRNEVLTAVRGRSGHIKFSTASVRNLLDETSVVLYTTSAACFDAVLSGRTAIYVGRDLALDYDKLPDTIALRCRSVEELRDLLSKPDLHAMSPQSSAALKDWLAPVVDAETLRSLLTNEAGMERGEPLARRGVM